MLATRATMSRRVGGTCAGERPHASTMIARLALMAAPVQAIRGLAWLLRGKRVRGWNLLYLAAAGHPRYYERWIEHGEPHIVRAVLNSGVRDTAMPSIGCVILVSGDAAAARDTLASVRAALGNGVPMWTDGAVLDGATALTPDTPLQDALRGLDPMPAWLLPLRAGDRVASTLGAVLRATAADPAVDTVVFWDEDTLHDGCRSDPWVKPAWDPIPARARDGVTGAAIVATQAALQVTPEASRFDAAGFAHLILRVVASANAEPRHIPLILSHRAARTPFMPVAEYRAMADACLPALAPATPAIWPTVSIIVPTRDRADLLETCLAGLGRLAYPGPVELLIVDNDSVEPATHALLARAQREGATVLRHPGAFNYAAQINRAAAVATGDMLCLLNNDVSVRDGEWLTRMVRYAVLDQVGAVGARLLYPDGTIQHAGVAVGIGDAAGHVQKGADPTDPHFADWHARTRSVSAVTAACLVVARATFEAVGGMDAETFAIDFNDVDFCLQLRARGLVNVVVAEATLVHAEAASRRSAASPESAQRFARELAALRTRWNTATVEDPHYSPLFRRSCERCVLAF